MSIPEQRLVGTGDEIGPAPGAASITDDVRARTVAAAQWIRTVAPSLPFAGGRRQYISGLYVEDILLAYEARVASLETSYASLRREHAATLAEWGARIEGLLTERAVYANQVAEMGGLLERVEPLADFAALAKPETLLAADLMGVESMEEAEQCSDEWMEINTAVRDYVAIHVSPLGGGE